MRRHLMTLLLDPTLQEEEAVAERFLHILSDVFSNQVGQLVSILFEDLKS